VPAGALAEPQGLVQGLHEAVSMRTSPT